MAKKQTKITKEETLETILFNCRNSLRGRAAMTDKRDLLLTLVFLKFIGERFKQQKDKIRKRRLQKQYSFCKRLFCGPDRPGNFVKLHKQIRHSDEIR